MVGSEADNSSRRSRTGSTDNEGGKRREPQDAGPRRLSLADLASESGVTRRTVRYYIGRGLLPRPESTGRGAHYTARHLELLERIGKLKAEGYTLAEIGSVLAGKPQAADLPKPDHYWSYRIAPDVVVMVRSDSTPWRQSRIKDALAEISARLDPSRDERQDARGSDTNETQGGTDK